MFDSLRQPVAMGFSLAQCGNHKARAGQAEERYKSLIAQIAQLEKEEKDLLNGVQQKQFELLNYKQSQLFAENTLLKSSIKQATLLRDAWANNPAQQAQLEGLGFLKKAFKKLNNVVSCDKYEASRAEWDRKSLPLENQRGQLQGRVDSIKKRLSPQNMQLMQKATTDLEDENKRLKSELAGIESQTDEYRKSHKLRVESERLALEQQAREKEQQAAQRQQVYVEKPVTQNVTSVASELTSPKQGSMMPIVLIAACVTGFFLLKPKKKSVKANV